MAGTRKQSVHNVERYFIYLVVIFCMTSSACSLQCLSQQNEAVDWFIAYKLPGSTKGVPKESFFYMDEKSPSWTLSSIPVTESSQAISNTLDQIYKNSTKNPSSQTGEVLYLMYNDEIPPESTNRRQSSKNGHTKGVIAFDSAAGFWLVHSTPKFPPPKPLSYSWPGTADVFAQSFLCVSMATDKNLDEIGKQLLYNYPDIYDKNLPESFASKYKNMAAVLAGGHVTEQPWFRETTLTSLAGVSFHSFAKYSEFGKDLYSDWLAPRFEDTLFVETWERNKKMCSNCTGKYKVFNINTLKFTSNNIQFKETQDHSKWAVTNSTASVWTCIGDINREESQMKRPGGTVCFQNKSVWQNFHKLISSYHDCKPYHKCIQPTFLTL